MATSQEKTNISDAAVRTFYENDFESMDRLDSGGEAITYKAYSAGYGQVCAKLFHARIIATNQDSRREINFLLKHAFHPNIVRVLGYYADKSNSHGQIGYVMEFMPGGSLHSVIYSQLKYSESDIYNWIIQAGRGLLYLHEAGIIHRDVKPLNMLLDKSRETLKLSDFGMAKAVYSDSCHFDGGTVRYMAPELISQGGKAFGPPSDVYALGISCWEMFHRKIPFRIEPDLALFSKITNGERPIIRQDLIPLLRELLNRCWTEEITKRCRIIELVKFAALKMEAKKRKIVPTATNVLPETVEKRQVATIPTVAKSLPETVKKLQKAIPTIEEILSGQFTIDTMVEVKPEAQKNTPETRANTLPETIKEMDTLPLPPHKHPLDNKAARIDNKVQETPKHEETQITHITWTHEHLIWQGLYLTTFFFSVPSKYIDASLERVTMFVCNCCNEFKKWKNGEKVEEKRLLMGRADGINDVELEDIYKKEYKETSDKIDFGIEFVYSKLAIICYYNSKFFTNSTEEKLEHMNALMQNLSRLLDKKTEIITWSLQARQFKCLIVGDGRIDPAQFHTKTTKFAPINQFYYQNFYTLSIPKGDKIEDRMDLIWNKIGSIGRVHSILLLLDDAKCYRNFAGKWERLIPYTAAVLFHDYSNQPTDEKTINQRHLQRVFGNYAHDIYICEDVTKQFVLYDDVFFIFYLAYDRSLNTLIDDRPPLFIRTNIERREQKDNKK